MHLWNLVRAIIDQLENKQYTNAYILDVITTVVKAWLQAEEAEG